MTLSISEPDCSNIYVGMEFNSYSDMCRTLGTTSARGDSLAAQKKLFSRYFNFEKIGKRKYVITEIYNKPLPRGLTSYGSKGCGRGKYVRYIEPLLRQIANRYAAQDSIINSLNSIDTRGNADNTTKKFAYTNYNHYESNLNEKQTLNSNIDSNDSDNNEDNNKINSNYNVESTTANTDNTEYTHITHTNTDTTDIRGSGFSYKYCCLTKLKLFQLLGFINENFSQKAKVLYDRKDIILVAPSKFSPDISTIKTSDEFDDRTIITTDDLCFFEDMISLIYEKWRSAEKAINNHGVIYCESVYTLPCAGGVMEADVLQTGFIRQAENNAFKDMELNSIQQVFTEHRRKLFYLKRNAEFSKIMDAPGVTVSESVKVTLNDDFIDRISGDVPEDEMRLMINKMIVEDFYKRIHRCKKQYDENCNNSDGRIWDSVEHNDGVYENACDNKIGSGSENNEEAVNDVWGISMDDMASVANMADVAAVTMTGNKDNTDNENSKGGGNTKNNNGINRKTNKKGFKQSSSLRSRVLGQPDFCKKMEKLVDIFILIQQ